MVMIIKILFQNTKTNTEVERLKASLKTLQSQNAVSTISGHTDSLFALFASKF